MTEELPLPPDVRATQADALRPLAFPWPCDAEQATCDETASHGARLTCCKKTVLLCHRHRAALLSEFVAANLADITLKCPGCGTEYPPPVRPGDMFNNHFDLGGTGA